jgi:hypothetical protein
MFRVKVVLVPLDKQEAQVLVVLAELQIVDKRAAAVAEHQEILAAVLQLAPATLAAVDKVEPLLVVVQMVVFRKQVNLVPLEAQIQEQMLNQELQVLKVQQDRHHQLLE